MILPRRIYDLGLSHKAVSVYCYLCGRADKNGECYPSVGRIAEDLSLSTCTVFRAFNELEKRDLLERFPRYHPQGGRRSSLLGTDHSYFENVAHDLFQGLSMLFVHSQHKEGQHNQHHTHSRYTVSGRFSEQKEKRYANKRSAREADKLPLGQIKHDLCFDFC